MQLPNRPLDCRLPTVIPDQVEGDANLDYRQFYIDGQWVNPTSNVLVDVVNPATEKPVAQVTDAAKEDAENAIAAARRAFSEYRHTSIAQRVKLLKKLLEEFNRRAEDIAQAISDEMGAPISFAQNEHTKLAGAERLREIITVLEEWHGDPLTPRSGAQVVRQPVGVCALITPWNYPINQIAQKVFPALAAGCTVVLKPSVYAPLDACILAECVDAAGFPKGVFNLIQGSGSEIGELMSSHPDINLVSLTGSVRAGKSVAEAAARTLKRVVLELGGKSANIVFADADLDIATPWSVLGVMRNSGQTCAAPTRMLVQDSVYDEVIERLHEECGKISVGDPSEEGDHIGPLVNKTQFDAVQRYIKAGIDEGARLLIGGLGRPDGIDRGYFAKPTIFADVTNDMTIAREEIFGPVLSVIRFSDEQEAISIANDTTYGLAGYIFSRDAQRIDRIARELEAGMIGVNGKRPGFDAPFGGFKQSGIGREGGLWGLLEYMETKSIAPYA